MEVRQPELAWWESVQTRALQTPLSHRHFYWTSISDFSTSTRKSTYLCVCVYGCLSVFSLSLSLCLSLIVYPSVCLSICLSVCFATVGPTSWNSLPEQLRQLNITIGQFKRSLKTFMFGLQGRGALWLDVKGADYEIFLLTYLLTYLSKRADSLTTRSELTRKQNCTKTDSC